LAVVAKSNAIVTSHLFPTYGTRRGDSQMVDLARVFGHGVLFAAKNGATGFR